MKTTDKPAIYQLLTDIGITESHNFRDRRIIQMLNVSAISFGLLLMVISYFNFKRGEDINGYILIGTGCVFFLNLVWNKMEYHLISKIVICFFITTIPFFNLIIAGRIPEVQYLSFITLGLVFTVVSILLFHSQKEKFMYYFSIVYYLLWILFSEKFFNMLTTDKPNFEAVIENYDFFKVVALSGFAAIVTITTIFKNIIHKYELENEIIKESLKSKNDELESYSNELEKRVKERTQELSIATNKVIDLAFITSHKIRGPLSSIIGTTKLLKSLPGDEEARAVLPQLHDKSVEMDEAIRSMIDVLQKTIKPYK